MLNPCHNGTGSPRQQLGSSWAEHWAGATWVGILVTSPLSIITVGAGGGAFLTTWALGSAGGFCSAQELGWLCTVHCRHYLHNFLHYSKDTPKTQLGTHGNAIMGGGKYLQQCIYKTLP